MTPYGEIRRTLSPWKRERHTLGNCVVTILFAATLLSGQQKTTIKTATQHKATTKRETSEHTAIRKLYEETIQRCDTAWDLEIPQNQFDVSALKILEAGVLHGVTSPAIDLEISKLKLRLLQFDQAAEVYKSLTGNPARACVALGKLDDEKARKDEYELLDRKLEHVDSCVLVYRTTINKKLSDLTVKETEQIGDCRLLALYPPSN